MSKILIVVDMQNDFIDGALGSPEVPLIVDAKGCAGVSPESHKRALEAMKVCQIKVIND